jgi:hypothetical protein
MARRRVTDADLEQAGESSLALEGTPELSFDAPESPRQRRARGTGNVLAVRLSDDGSVDTEHMRPDTVGRLKTAVQKSNLIETEADKRASFAVLVPPIYKILGGLEALVTSYTMKAPREDCVEVLAYTEDEVKLLCDPTTAVLAKYSGAYMATHLEEFALVLHLVSIHQTKLALLHERILERRAAETKATPIDTNLAAAKESA